MTSPPSVEVGGGSSEADHHHVNDTNTDSTIHSSTGGGKTVTESAVPLSASAISFNPNTTSTGTSPSGALWGAIGQSYSYSTDPAFLSGGSEEKAINKPISMGVDGVGTMNTTLSTSTTTQESSSLGGLWNFGGFDVDALTDETRAPPGTVGGGRDSRGGGSSSTNSGVTGLSSAFGNFGLRDGPTQVARGGQGNNKNYGGAYPSGLGAGGGGGNGAHLHPGVGGVGGGKYGAPLPQDRHDSLLGGYDAHLGPSQQQGNGEGGYGNLQQQQGMGLSGNQGQQQSGYGLGGGTGGHYPYGAPVPLNSQYHQQLQGNNRYPPGPSAGFGLSNGGGPQFQGGRNEFPAGPPLPLGGLNSSIPSPRLGAGGDAGLSGPYPPSFPAGGSGGMGGNGNGGGAVSPNAPYHQGPGWDQLPRWGGGAAGQISYGTGCGGGGGGMSGALGGYGGGMGGSAGGDDGRPSYPPYPMPPAEFQSGGGYDQYQSTGYNPSGPGGGLGIGGYQGNARGGDRTNPSFNSSMGSTPSYYGNNARGSGGGGLNNPSLSGPYPPSFQAGDSSGVRALGGMLQSQFNANESAQQRKYPAILGGSPDALVGGGMLLGGGYSGASTSSVSLAGGNGSQQSMSVLRPTTQSIGSMGDISPTDSFGTNVSNPNTVVSGVTGLTGGGSFSTSYLGGGVGVVTPSTSVGTVRATTPGAPKDAPILPKRIVPDPSLDNNDDDDIRSVNYHGIPIPGAHDSQAKKREWLLNMNATLESTPVGQLDPNILPLSTIMNGWAKQKSSEGARMVEMWLDRVHSEYNAENPSVHPTARMYTMAVDAWAKSNGGAPAARRAEALLERMDRLYREGGGRHEALKPTTGIFNAVINAWARSREKIAPQRAEQILSWMETLRDKGGEELDISPDKYTFNTVIHAYAKSGAKESATKAHRILDNMNQMYREGNSSVKPDTITYNVVINAYAKSGGKGAAQEAENLLQRMHMMYDQGDLSVKPNVVTYGAVIDAFAKSMERNAAARADALLANMVALHQSDPVRHADLRPNTYVFNTVINAWAKSKERGAAAKAEEMLVAMDRLHASGFPGLKPDAFTYTAVIDAYAKSGYRGAASRADLLLDQMEAKYAAGDQDLKPNTFTYNAVINALAKSGEPGAAARAERVLHNMVNRLRNNGSQDVKPTTINFNTVLDAWAKSGEGEAAAERAEAILEWMDRLNKAGNIDVKPDTITFNAVIDAWARSGCKRGPQRAEQILNHMDELYQGGNIDVKPDTYTYNTLINALAKSSDGGSASRAEEILKIMEDKYSNGDSSYKPNTRSHTSVIDAWAKSGEAGAARRAEMILNNLRNLYEATGDPDIKPNVYTANAVMNVSLIPLFSRVDRICVCFIAALMIQHSL